MSIFTGVDHISIITRDMDKSVAFYTDVLGFKLLSMEDVPQLGLRIAFIDLAGISLEMVQKTGGNEDIPEGDGVVELLSFRVSDMDEAIARLKAHGVSFLMDEPIKMGPDDCFIMFRGPSGEKLELICKK